MQATGVSGISNSQDLPSGDKAACGLSTLEYSIPLRARSSIIIPPGCVREGTATGSCHLSELRRTLRQRLSFHHLHNRPFSVRAPP